MKITLIILLILFSFNPVYAQNAYDYYYYGNGGANYTKLNKSAISKIAKAEIKRLLLKKKIPSSWRGMKIFKIDKSNSSDWKIIFNNPNIKVKLKQKIYIFIDVYGKVLGTNYTAK